MPRFRQSHEIAWTEETTEERSIYRRELREDEVTDAFSLGGAMRIDVAANSTAAVPFGGVNDGRLLYIECANEVRLRFNGGSEELRVVPRARSLPANSGNLPGRFYVWTEGLTSLTLVNPSTTTAIAVTVVLGGE